MASTTDFDPSQITLETPVYGPFFGVIGITAAVVLSALGAAYGTAKSGTGIAAMAIMRPDLVIKSMIPIVMAGIIAIYGVVTGAVLVGQIKGAAEGYKIHH